MRIGVLLAVAGLTVAFLAGAVATKAGRYDRPPCASVEGTVLGYLPTTSHTCSPSGVAVGQSLFAKETIQSTGVGNFTFRTAHLHKCIQYAVRGGTADVLRPRSGVALRHLYGLTWCRHLSSDDFSRTLTSPGAAIRLNGTTFGFDSDGKRTTVKVSAGTVKVLGTSGLVVTIHANHQATFPPTGNPSRVTTFTPTSEDTQATALLQVDATLVGVPEVAERVRSRGETSVVLVAQDSSTEENIRSELAQLGVKSYPLTIDQVRSNPTIISLALKKISAQEIVVAGASAAAKSLLDDVRKAAGNVPIMFIDNSA